MTYHHPLAYLVAVEGLALLRAWGGDHDEAFVRARLTEVRALLDDERLAGHPGVHVRTGATTEAYREWAGSYDDGGNELLELDLPALDAVLATVPPGDAVDVGCGTGRLAARLMSRGHRVVGIDGSAAMLERARDRVPGARFELGDLGALPLPDASADVVTSGLALTHVADLAGAYAEMARVLRPGGTAVVSDVHPDLVSRGSVVKGETADGAPLVAATNPHTVADHVRAALSAGLEIRGLTEQPPTRDAAPAPPGLAADREVGEWRWWPWTLLEWVPAAARVAWDVPSILVWHLERPDGPAPRSPRLSP